MAPGLALTPPTGVCERGVGSPEGRPMRDCPAAAAEDGGLIPDGLGKLMVRRFCNEDADQTQLDPIPVSSFLHSQGAQNENTVLMLLW